MRHVNLRILVAFLLSTALLAGCMDTKLPENYEVTPEVLETHGGKINVSIKGNIPEKSFHKKAIVEVTPVLKYAGQETALKSVTLKGEKAEGSGITINSKTGGSITYSDQFDYKPEMNVSELWVRAKLNMKGKITDLGEVKIADGVIYTSTRVSNDSRTAASETAAHKYEKETIISKDANIYFAYNSSNLNLRLELNKTNADKIDELKDFVRQGWVIKDIAINAWASPEGELSLNQELSEDRAKRTQKYVEKELKRIARERDTKVTFKKPAEDLKFVPAAKGEDFDGFMKALQKSDIKDKNAITNVIKSQATKAEREKKIKDMTVIYAEIEDMLSVLRRGEIVVSCYEPKKSDEKIAQLSTTYPDSLDVKELLYAATLTNDLNTQLKIYQAAIKVFPKDWRGYNNAAVVYLKQGNIEDAKVNLDKANALNPNDGQVLNNLGVIAAMNKDFAAAKSFYNEAEAKGVNVTYNKGVLMILDGNYEAAIAALSSKKCDYNLALAKLMNGNTNESKTILECAEKSAEVYYLLAVVAARTNKAEAMIVNLTKAIQEVPAYKNQAKEDREFIKYFENAAFKALIK